MLSRLVRTLPRQSVGATRGHGRLRLGDTSQAWGVGMTVDCTEGERIDTTRRQWDQINH